jgi:guanosine-3',5'-bis(diphosphate) 3'-pyrophosphohydrolase
VNIPPQIQAGDTATILAALQFTVEKTFCQLNGQADGPTEISHRLVVTEILSRIGQVTDITTLTAAILHHVYDGTLTNKLEFDQCFGSEVRFLVQELAVNRDLSELERLQSFVDRAPELSTAAKQIVLAEKICRLQEISETEPRDWSFEQKSGYMTWLARVVAGCRGANPHLEEYFNDLFQERINLLLHAA